MTAALTLLAFGAHPDDIEIGMGGTAALHAQKGDKVAFCSLTRAELSSNGDIKTRQKEAAHAAETLGAQARYQLNFPDRNLTKESPEYAEIVTLIRYLRPDIVFFPWHEDRHPDHIKCGAIIKEALFDAGIRRYTEAGGDAWRVPYSYQYSINGMISGAAFYIDISSVQSLKEESLLCYESQFILAEESVHTPLTSMYIESVRARDLLMGKQASVSYAEAFTPYSPVLLNELPGRKNE
ncbi:bacillithiol biosynthesis deacetylase BshB1 [Sinobaca qinghaiensis]|uniref:Bacillithiol biosynthesis deacetylase BshB1 n=1 Tax=Sinobaca qinghaiensis TaxID=342944 RepID=A0A419V346_9BACL|nr:bacillithiol biosynthesis deacetylase BshB1 [Sinobaca qinghaiensis]RKD72831.1 bacillithiol biosynthesis deacetylase BshB1 [Sinobaca qinghaiensis]